MSESTALEPPEGLGEAGTRLWSAVTGWLELDVDELALLAAACHTADELARLEETLAAEPLVSAGSTGQPKAHPLLAEVRAHREALRKLLDSLRIPMAGGSAGSDWGKWAASRRWRGK